MEASDLDATTDVAEAIANAAHAEHLDLTAEERAYVEATVRGWELELASRTFPVHDQTPPRGYRGIKNRAKQTYPGVPFSTVRAFAYNRVRYVFEEPLLRHDGTLGPSVVHPGVTLTPDQAERLVALVTAKATGRASHYWGPPTHAFVFYDDRERPVATLTVNFSTGTLDANPTTDDFQYELDSAKEEGFRTLCRELGFPDCEPIDYDQKKKTERSPGPPAACR